MVWSKRSALTPTILTLAKTYSGPENETATGPNFVRTFTIAVDIADGQEITDLDVSDVLPDNVQFAGNVVALVHGVPTSPTIISTPALGTPGGTLTRQFASVTGQPGNDISLSFEFYIPRDDAGTARVINPASGNDVTSPNQASALGDWTPKDGRDSGGIDNVAAGEPGPEYTLTDKSIAIQKGHTNTTDSVNSPGDVLQYTYTIQVSDFFAFQDLEITDLILDGQHFNSAYSPTMQVNGNSFTLGTAAINAANYTVDESEIGFTGPGVVDDGTDGSTTLIFRLSDELNTRRGDARLLGGCVPLAGGTADCNVYNNGATDVTITYQTVILENFTDTYPSGDASVDQGDVFSNSVDILGTVLENATLTPNALTPQTEADDSDESLEISRDELNKYIFAINGSTTLPDPIHVQPGDEITFQLTYDLPTSDVEDLYITDYIPLPVLDVDDFNGTAPGIVALGWTTSAGGKCDNLPPAEQILPGSPDIPISGIACLGATDTFSDYSLTTPTVSSDSAANSIEFFYGDFDDPRDQATLIDILFTITVNNEPYADGLYFTNQSEVHEGSTNSGNQFTNTIVNFILDEPYLVLDKGAIASDNPNAIFVPDPTGPVPFTAPSSAGIRWVGTISSDALGSNPITSAVSEVDAGDLVSFALVIENLGNSPDGAFDIKIKDTLPVGFSIPSGGSGLNLTVFRGDGGAITYLPLDLTGAVDLGGDDTNLFAGGLELIDSTPFPSTLGVCQQYHPTNGSNIIILIYDLQVDDDINPLAELENTGTDLQLCQH